MTQQIYNKSTSVIPVQMLGQAGLRLDVGGLVIYVDPYLSNSVEERIDQRMERQVPIPIRPEEITDADYVLITHDHMDHCDPATLIPLEKMSPQAIFVGPSPVLRILRDWVFPEERMQLASESWTEIASGLGLKAVPAAHPTVERDAAGNLRCVGYLLSIDGEYIYISGDTSVATEVIRSLEECARINTAFLPVNEANFFRDRMGIIGNMSVREAFEFAEAIGVKSLVPVHWDMFRSNSVSPDEIKIVYEAMKTGFSLNLAPTAINLSAPQVSIVIRTLNEAEHLADVLKAIRNQTLGDVVLEVILVDSGSTDGTLDIAARYDCIITHIKREDFSFGRSLNVGCEASNGDVLVFVSGHCVPDSPDWLMKLVQPILAGEAVYSYGRQKGGSTTYFSEARIFEKYFPGAHAKKLQDFYCNNANSAIARTAWERHRFDENLTGLEDMALAQKIVKDGGKVTYVPEAPVIHYHNETWKQVKRRFEREAIALQEIMPNVHIHRWDLVRYIASSIWTDWKNAWKQGIWRKHAYKIIRYRVSQYVGSYKGNHRIRRLSQSEKDRYFYPE